MKRRFSAILLALALCLGLTAPALAGSNVTSGSCGQYAIWTFDQDTGTLTISGKGATDGWGDPRRDPVPWAAVVGEIRAVVIEEGITGIGTSAFSGCADLIRVTVPKSLERVGAAAFEGTLWLKSQGEFAVANGILIKYQGSAEKVVIPDGVTRVASAAFSHNQTVASVVIPEGVVSLADNVFLNCENLAKIDFPGTLRQVGASCVYGTKWLDDQKGDFILAGHVLLKYRGEGGDVVIPDGVTDVEDAAFTWSSWFPCGEDLELGALTVPASMLDLNAELAFYTSVPKSVVYQGGRDRWNQIEHTEWYGGQEVPVRCSGTVDPARVFTDMEPKAFYLDAVAWAVNGGVTTGKTATTFAPKEDCTHAQILTFLWRAAGEPQSSIVAPFAMKEDEFYYGAAKWAYEKGMINAAFSPDAPCNRADAVSYIWQARGKPYAAYDGRFADLPANSPYAAAVAWAVASGVTTGTSAAAFSPGGVCNRGQIVTFLYRAYQ